MTQTFNLRPVASSSTYDTWTLGAGSSKAAAVDPGNPVSHDDSTSYISINRTVTTRQGFTLLASRPEMASVASVSGYCRWRNINNPDTTQIINIHARRGGTDGAVLALSNQGSTFGTGDVTGSLPRPGGGSWTYSDVMDPSLEIVVYVPSWNATNPGTVEVTSLYIVVTYEPSPTQIGPSREVASRHLWWRRRPSGVVSMNIPLDVGLDLELLDDFALSHFAMPEPTGAGAGTKKWQRAPMRLIQAGPVDIGSMSVPVLARDLRPFLCTLWRTHHSKRAVSAIRDGLAALDKGNTETITRASKAWIEDPTDQRIVEIQQDQDKQDNLGLLIERASTNYLLNSAYKNWSAGAPVSWTLGGTGVNGSTITQETGSIQKFDTGVSGSCMKLTAGTPMAAEMGAVQITGTITANSKIGVSFWHYDASSAPLYWRLRRQVDNWYWNQSGQAWQAASVDNPATVSNNAWAREVSLIDVGTSNTTVSLNTLQQTGGTSGRINYVAESQIEIGTPSSAILTETATVTRAADSITVSNNSTGVGRCWTATRGTFYVSVIPNWNRAEVLTVNRTVAYVGYDANNWFWTYYDGANQRWVFEVRAAGTTYRATFAAPGGGPAEAIRGTARRITCRWTSSEGELNLTNYTASIFMDGVKGTDVVFVATPTETASSNLEFGSKSTAEHFDGHLRYWVVRQVCDTDEQIARGA